MTFYHPNLRSLRDAAAAGCEMCRLCWTAIKQKCSTEEVDAVLAGRCPKSEGGQRLHDERVWLTGFFQDNFRGRGTPGSGKVAKDAGSKVLVGCGNKDDPEATVSEPVLSAELAVFADPGTPAASRFVERYITADRNPDGHVEFARALLNVCKKNHPECGLADAESMPEMPTRVLDVGTCPGSVKLVLARERGLRDPYLALSYCWGQGVRYATELKDENIASLLEFVDEMSLAATQRECITIARQLGIRYVWIDSLCIIQGNLADWEYESKGMAQVYGNATLTVIAARSADSRLGFVTNRLEQAAPPCALPFGRTNESGEDMGDVFLCLPRSGGGGPLNARGWCFQEGVLSRRKIIFETQKVYFSCQRSERWEDGALNESDRLRAQLFRSLPRNALGKTDTETGNQKLERELLRTQMLELWYKKILFSYTQRQLTNPFDIFAAISSIAQLGKQTIGSRYLAGIWEGDMVRGLLWQTWFSFGAKTRRDLGPIISPLISIEPRRPTDWNGKTVVRAPSWSWASIQGQVHERSTPRNRAQYQDPSNYLIRPKHKARQETDDTYDNEDPRMQTWTALDSPNCDADVLSMTICELHFLGYLKHVRIFQIDSETALADILLNWPIGHPFCRQRHRLAAQGYMAILEPAESEYTQLDKLGLLPFEDKSSASSPSTAISPASTFAVTCFDIAAERVGITDCWFLPLLKEIWEGLLLYRDPSDGKFRRLGIVAAIKKQFLPWVVSGPEKEVHLV
ncbi:HET-domain-containing protein [Hypoxylon sp. FL0543]|nr:HET-domain-containing protein [Hypoxylon sp. FL0543]